MYVSAVVKARLGSDGRAAPTGVEGKFTCPMHPQVLQDAAGACPLCHMPLEQVPSSDPEGAHFGHGTAAAPAERYFCPMKCEGEKTYDAPGNCPVCGMKLVKAEAVEAPGRPADVGPLAVPASAVLDSGTRRIVYVEKGRGTFELREVTLGPRGGEFFPVLKGLTEGERVVTRGGFLIDSQFQITGHPSLYYPGGLDASTRHEHGGAEAAPAGEPATEQPTSTAPAAPSAGGHQH
jgi:Cu(I)/Ag(I) efflux system membrane fusion protein